MISLERMNVRTRGILAPGRNNTPEGLPVPCQMVIRSTRDGFARITYEPLPGMSGHWTFTRPTQPPARWFAPRRAAPEPWDQLIFTATGETEPAVISSITGIGPGDHFTVWFG